MKREVDKYLDLLETKDPKIRSAFSLAYKKHQNQKRKSGEPYIEHCLEVYCILKSWGVSNTPLLISALLHDIVEDTETSILSIKKIYGEEVSFIVEGVTKDHGSDIETLKKLVGGSYINPKIAVLKLADRLHNLRTLYFMPEFKRYKKAEESLGIYAQLAEALGIWVVKNEFEDLSFKYLASDKYIQLKLIINNDPRVNKKFISSFKKKIENALFKNTTNFEIKIKKASYYHIYQKGKFYSIKGLSEYANYKKINDVISFRVIVDKVENCYKALHHIHNFFGKSVDYERLDEFIASNKRENGYEAIQTTIETINGSVEIAIMTKEMENFNNWGFITLLNSNEDISGYKLKLIFTPGTDLIFLPLNATVLDFAYLVNPKLGDKAVSAIVNKKEKHLSYKIKNGDIVKIITGKRNIELDKKISKKCLPKTKKLLQKKISEEEKSRFILQGKALLEEYLSLRGILDLKDLDKDIHEITYLLGCETIDEIYYRIATGYLDIGKINNLLNQFNINKNVLKWTTIKVRGSDKPGILNFISGVIKKYSGNIIKIHYKRDQKTFFLRIVAEGIKLQDEPKIVSDLEKKSYFKNIVVV